MRNLGTSQPIRKALLSKKNLLTGLLISATSYAQSFHIPAEYSRDGRVPVVLETHQITRPQFEERFQPVGRASRDESFQVPNSGRPLDILVIIDDSGSMSPYQQQLANRLAPLISYLTSTDWQIHVVTTSSTCPSRGTIKATDPNREALYRAAITAGTSGDSNEQGILMARQALETPCSGANWLRNDSVLSILIVTDEDNCSDGTGCGANAWGSERYLLDYLSAIRHTGVVGTPGVTAKFFGILPSDPSQYDRVVRETGGVAGRVGDLDYAPVLSQVSYQSATMVRSLSLQDTPVANSIVITANGAPYAGNWQLQGKTVVFADPLPSNSTIQIHYEVQVPNPGFTLARRPDPASIVVLADGVTIPSSEYTYTAATNTLVVAPSATTVHQYIVRYKANVSLPTSFTMGWVDAPGDVLCSVNGLSLSAGEYGYIVDSQTVQFATAPAEGALIQCTGWKEVGL